MMCHNIGCEPIGIMGLGMFSEYSRIRVPRPPQKSTTFILGNAHMGCLGFWVFRRLLQSNVDRNAPTMQSHRIQRMSTAVDSIGRPSSIVGKYVHKALQKALRVHNFRNYINFKDIPGALSMQGLLYGHTACKSEI